MRKLLKRLRIGYYRIYERASEAATKGRDGRKKLSSRRRLRVDRKVGV
jgi:hypothetical protein